MVNIIQDGLCFDDVLLVPQYSKVKSRSQVELSVGMKHLQFSHPIIPANMSSITGKNMAMTVIRSGGLAILHRFMPEQQQLDIAGDIVDRLGDKNFATSLGVKESDIHNFEDFYQLGVRIFCIDIAHGDSAHCENMTRALKELHSDIVLIAGNVATGDGAYRLWRAGADVVKVGVGPGSLCSTRIQTGNGIPQLTALMDVYQRRENAIDNKLLTQPAYIIADGGIKNSGDVVKSLCLADMVMIGNLFAGCDETPGERRYIHGVCHKEYRGSSTHKTNHIEGVSAWVPCTGTYQEILTKLLEGLRSGCSYQGANSLLELKDNPTFIRITSAGLRESHPHDVIVK